MRNPHLFSVDVSLGDSRVCYETGITLRDLAAIAAMQGILANPTTWADTSDEKYAEVAVGLADALLAELEKET